MKIDLITRLESHDTMTDRRTGSRTDGRPDRHHGLQICEDASKRERGTETIVWERKIKKIEGTEAIV